MMWKQLPEIFNLKNSSNLILKLVFRQGLDENNVFGV